MEALLELVKNFWTSLQSGQLPDIGFISYFLLAFLVAIEGPFATLLGAAAASAGFLRPDLVFVSAAAGNLTADLTWYSLGYAGKVEWLMRHGARLGLKPRHMERLQQEMHANAAKILLLAKLTAGFMIPSLIAAGLARAPWRKWLPALLAGETLWTGSLVLIGYYTTEGIKQIQRGVEYIILAASLIFLMIAFFLIRKALQRSKGYRREFADFDNGGGSNTLQDHDKG